MLGGPSAIGVAMGPFSATRLRRTDSTAWACADSLPRRSTGVRADTSSHWMETPVALMIRCAACATSGPMPSPGIRVTMCGIETVYSKGNAQLCRRRFRDRTASPSARYATGWSLVNLIDVKGLCPFERAWKLLPCEIWQDVIQSAQSDSASVAQTTGPLERRKTG